MQTDHRIVVGNAQSLSAVGDNAVELVVTSPPYPMIEMWDELFGRLNPDIETALAAGAGEQAFELMHKELEAVWAECQRVLVEGGIACINVGDATRTVGDEFRVYANHTRITDAFTDLGFVPLPDILWRKPTNTAAKFMGSGMIPPNAYATLEHEHLLIFRNGPARRQFQPGAKRRYEAAYFWEERNEWFSDLWSDITGIGQTLSEDTLRDRSAAYPLAIPYRLINMYSVYGDTVIDPFWGTGTTSLAAMIAGRNSIGYELHEEFTKAFRHRLSELPAVAAETVTDRLTRHVEFVHRRRADGDTFDYEAEHYEFPVMTKQEQQLRLYTIEEIQQTDFGHTVVHTPYEDTPTLC